MEEFQYSDCEDSETVDVNSAHDCNNMSQTANDDREVKYLPPAVKNSTTAPAINPENRLLLLSERMGKRIQDQPDELSKYYSELYELARDFCDVFEQGPCDQGDKVLPIKTGQQQSIFTTPTKKAKLDIDSDGSAPGSPSSPGKGWNVFTEQEDIAIIALLIQKKLHLRLSDSTIWTDLFENLPLDCKNRHTRGSVQNRFRKIIFPNITAYTDKGDDQFRAMLKKELSFFPPKYQGYPSPKPVDAATWCSDPKKEQQ